MAENSETLATSGKRRTKSTANLTPDEALQILQSAVAMCQDSGLVVLRAPLHERGITSAAIVIPNAEWVGTELRAITGKGVE